MTGLPITRRAALGAGAAASIAVASACASGQPATPQQPGANDAAYQQTGPITYVQNKDLGRNVQKEIDKFNAANPNEKVTLRELPQGQERQEHIQNAENRSDAFNVLALDVVWIAEFAAKQYVDELKPADYDLTGFLKPTIDAVTYFNKVYAIPRMSDGALLFYRKDWLDAAGVSAPPKTWEEVKSIGEQVKAKVPEAKGADIYGGQFQKYEGLTCNFAEFVNAAGGAIIDDAGKPVVNTPEAISGLQQLADWYKDKTLPEAATTWSEEESRDAFQQGKLIFLRNWPYVYPLANKTDGSSKVANKFAVAPLPGKTGTGVSTLGGWNLAISKFAKNKGTAVKFIKYITSKETTIARTKVTSEAPPQEDLYTQPDLVKAFPYLPTLKESIGTAKARPKAVKYGDVTRAIQDAAYAAIRGQKTPEVAMKELQTALEGLIK